MKRTNQASPHPRPFSRNAGGNARVYSLIVLIVAALMLGACNDDAPAADVAVADAAASEPAANAPSRIPAEIARLPLVEGETVLRDFRLDAANGVAYVTDSAYTLHVVALDPLQELANFATTGDLLTLDAANARLYIAPHDLASGTDAAVTVFDTANRTLLWSVLGSRVTVDSGRNRYYVGDVAQIGAGETMLGVRLYNGETQQLIAQGQTGGTPLYNPARDEVIVYSHSAQTLDPESLAVRSDLFPDITAESLPGCTGCRFVRNVWLLEPRGTMAFDIATLSGGAGAGAETGPLLYDSVTMTPSDDRRSLSLTCSSQPVLNEAVVGGFLHHDGYSRYEVYNNLTVRGLSGETLVFKDGLGAPFVNPFTGAAYLATTAGGTWVVDARTLAPLGVSAPFCPFASGAGDRFFATDGAHKALLQMAGMGGTTLLPVAEPLTGSGLVGKQIKQILLSPNFGRDATIFLVIAPTNGGDQMLRSTDAGASWTVIGGIPTGGDLALTLAISPDYANDGTLFLGGYRSTFAGEGVWRSVDGGDSWAPLWNGLEHLRVFQIRVSPTFAADGLVHAFSNFTRIVPWEAGASVSQWQKDQAAWDPPATIDPTTFAPSTLLPLPQGSELPVRKASYAEPIEVQDANGNWQQAGKWATNQTLRALLPSPNYADDGTIYVVTDLALYRTTDRGATWQQLQDARLDNLTWDHLLTSAALSPVLGDGTYRLLIGTMAGDIWQEDPATLHWDVPGAVPTVASPLPTPATTPAPVETATLGSTPTTSVPATGAPVTNPPVTSAPTATQATAAPTTAAPTTAAPTTAAPTTDTPAAEGGVSPRGLWGSRWAESPELQQALGLALTAEPAGIPAAYQFFEKGTMVWRSDTGMMVAILNDGSWMAYPDTFVEGEMERDPNIYTPGELLQPERGFGKVWREHDDLREAIGWARAEEQGVTAQVQEFQKGFAMRLSGLEFILLHDGTRRN